MKTPYWVLIPVLLSAVKSQALPTIYPTNLTSLSGVQNPTTSNLVSDDTDLRKIYVLPPNTGEAIVQGFHTPTANLGFCAEMKSLQHYSAQVSARLDRVAEQEAAQFTEVQKIQLALNQARLQAAKFVAEKKLQALSDLDLKIQEMEDRLSALYKENESCQQSCEAIRTEITKLEKEKSESMRLRREIFQQNVQDSRIYDRHKASVQALQENLSDASEAYAKLADRLIAIRNQFLSMYERFSQMEGGRASFVYQSQWDNNVIQLRQANPSFEFEKIQTENARIYAALSTVRNLPAGGAIMAYELPGETKEQSMELKSGFPGSLSANIVLSLVGACPLLHPQDFGIPASVSTDGMRYGLTATYDFPSAMRMKVTASYNMYKMYQKIVSSGSSGGFFSSRSWTDVEERNFFRDSFKVNWEEQDPQNTLSLEQKLAIEKDMRAHILERMATLVLPSVPDRNALLQAAAPPAHGAVVVASSLTQACPTNIYCVGGSILMNVLDAIFGSSSASSNYTQIHDVWVEENWENTKVVLKPWITTYLPVQN